MIQNVSKENWKPDSWQNKEKSKYVPIYKNTKKLNKIKTTLKTKRNPIVFANEIRDLKKELVKVNDNKSFILQGGECTEGLYEKTTTELIDFVKLFIELSIIISYVKETSVVNIGSIAGQYSKSISNMTEKRNDEEFPSYFGDMINNIEFDNKSREPEPKRMLMAHDSSVNTMNVIRAIFMSRYVSLDYMEEWMCNYTLMYTDIDFNVYNCYKYAISSIKQAMKFSQNNNMSIKKNISRMYTSHEGLSLDYEECMVKKDTMTNKYYDCSSHMLWLGEKTRSMKGQHIEFLRGIENPVGITVGPDFDKNELIEIIKYLNPTNEKGKIILICRFGLKNVTTDLHILLNELERNAHLNVILMLDPMYGNTIRLDNGLKTREFQDILHETSKFFRICQGKNVYVGGVNLEITTDDKSSECVGGLINNNISDIERTFNCKYDPRLNKSQCIEYIFLMCKYYEIL